MHMKKKWTARLLLVALLLTLLAGCSSSNEETASEPAATAASVESSSEVSTEIPEPETSEISTVEESNSEETTAEEAKDYREPLSYPLADGDVTFTILHAEPMLGPMSGQMAMTTYGDFETIALGNEYIGVTPGWQSLSQMSGDTQFNLIVASGDYPDVFTAIDKYYVGSFQKAYEDDVIITLDDYIADDMPEYWNLLQDDPDLMRAVTNDNGEFMAWYSIFDKQLVNEGYFIRQDWLDKLGMEVPTDVEQLNEFAYAAKSEFDLESVFIMGEGLGTFIEAWGLGNTIASGSGFSYHREGDRLVADITSPQYKEYVEQLHQWYVDGIVSQNFSELDTGNMAGDNERELAENRTAIVRTMVNSMDNLLNDDPDFALAPMVVTVDGGNIHTGRGERQFDSCSISTACEKDLIPYILGWMNYWYTEEGAIAGSYGVEGKDFDYDENGEIYYTEAITQNDLGYPPMLYSRARCFSGTSFGLMLQDRTTPFYTEAQTNAIEVWTARTDDEAAVPKSLSLNTEESETVALHATDLATYISEEIPKFVTGDRDMDTWDDFIADCENMHVEELLAAYQGAFDRNFQT